MTIIHYIPTMDLKKGIAPHYVNSLVRATARVATSYVIEEKDLGTPLLDFTSNAVKQLKKHRPDIVHIHAAWDFRSALLGKIARRMGLFVVVSPHGGLSQVKMEQRFWKEKLPRILAYQFRMMRKSRLVITVSDKEKEELGRLGWKRRMITVPEPSVNNIGDDELCSMIMAAYRKVIDTHYLERITEDEIGFTIRCVREALRREGHFMQDDEPYTMPKDLSFRRIYIFAHDNGVTPLLLEGAKRLGIAVPQQLNIETLPRFTEKPKHQGSKEKSFRKFCEILQREIPDTANDKLFTPQGEISLLAFANAYCAIRFNDYDEEKFVSSINDARLEKYTSRMMYLFQELFNLEEGFMPIGPR